MTKTTFLGYVPSLKSKHEATIVNGRAMKSKGGSIRYLLEGEYDGRKTLPKTVSKEDFVKVYGFDAKEAEAVIVSGSKGGEPIVRAHKIGQEEKDGFIPSAIAPIMKPQEDIPEDGKEFYENHADTVGSPSPADVEPPAPSEKPFPQEPSNENFSADYQTPAYSDESITYYDSLSKDELEAIEQEIGLSGKIAVLNHITKHKLYDESEVKEALGLFGKKEEEEEKEESDEPKTQEFTVVLQEGDKLELTDIEEEENEEEQAAPDDENTEKEPETVENEEKEADEDMVERTFFITDAWYDTYDETDEDSFEDQYGYKQSDEQPKFEDDDLTLTIDAYPQEGYGELSDSLADALSNSTGFGVYHFDFVEIMPDGSKKVLEAVQAKVTRPVKEDETEDEEESDEEGLSTGAKVALGVGALAAGVALFGAEDDPYENQTDYSRIYEATSGDGYINHDRIDTEEKRMVELRYDDPTTYYDWNSQDEVEEDDVEDAIREELGDEPGEGAYGATVEVKNQNNPDKYVEVDVDMDTDYNDYRFMGLAAEHESESDGYAYAYTKGHEDGMGDEVIYRPRIATDKGRNIYKKILKQKAEGVHGAESFEAEKHRYQLKMGWDIQEYGNKEQYAYKDGVEVIIAPIPKNSYQYNPVSAKWKLTYGRETPHGVVPLAKLFGTYREVFRWLNNPPFEVKSFGADAVGNPSPSGPSSTPEPAEATGSEPSNEEFKGENRNLAIGLTAAGVGLVALLGADRIKKLFDRFNL